MKSFKIATYFIIAIIISGCSTEEQCIDSDLVIINTMIYTANHEDPIAEALAIKGNKLIYVGKNSGVGNFNCGNIVVLDLKNSYVYPGFIDAHAHLKGIGYRELDLNLQGADSLKSMLTQVQIHSNKVQSGNWVVGRGWIEKKWPEARFPTLEELDAISVDKPIALERADGHAIIVNSLALQLAKIDRTTPDPIGGKIDKDKNGEPN